jgi:UDP-N-acetylglucosamine 2-epimerase
LVVATRPSKYKICHIEAGMRSFDKRMLEEINRTVCDHCSDILFVYHDEYKRFLEKENIKNNVYVVGNTIVEVANKFKEDIMNVSKKNNMILIDIHRPENFKYKNRLENIIEFGNLCANKYNLPVKMLYFKRLKDNLEKFNISLGNIEMIDLLPYKKYLNTIYHSKFIISDSGTGQEEPALFNTKVLVPRDFSERPQSYEGNCSFKFRVENKNYDECFEWIEKDIAMDLEWLGKGNTAELIIKHLKELV